MTQQDMKIEDFHVGDFVTFSKSFSNSDFSSFAALSGDLNPLHHDADYAGASDFKRTIVPMYLAASPFSAIAGMMIPGHRSLYLGSDLRALAPIPYDQTLTYSAIIKRIHHGSSIIELDAIVFYDHTVCLEGKLRVQIRNDVDKSFAPSRANIPAIMPSQQGCYALVTGASGEIGSATARALSKLGWNLILHANSNQNKITELASQLPSETKTVVGDLSRPEGISNVIEAMAGLPVTRLIHTASPALFAPFEQQIAVNHQALYQLGQAVLANMLTRQDGHILFLGSTAVHNHPLGWESYVGAKTAGISVINAFHSRFSKFGVQASVLAPSYVLTSFSQEVRPQNAIGLLPEEVANAIVSQLECPKGPYITLEPGTSRHGYFDFHPQDNAPIKSPNIIQPVTSTSTSSPVETNIQANIDQIARAFFKLEPNTSLNGAGIGRLSGWDSLGHLELMTTLESQLNIGFSSAEITQTTDIIGIYKLVDQKLKP